jgi:ribonuclease HII
VIGGVDEAGKGSVLGPMVVGAVAAPSMEACADLGVHDSKVLTRRRREALYEEITAAFSTAVVVISAGEIDALRKEMTMNDIVVRAHASAIKKVDVTCAYVDACDVNARRYGETLSDLLTGKVEIVSEHKADARYPVVSAASICAKVTRDRLIDELVKEYGPIGSGYPSDPVTIAFLEDAIKTTGTAPSIARHSWKTIANITGKVAQTSLFEF